MCVCSRESDSVSVYVRLCQRMCVFVCQQVREQKRELVTESVTPAVCVSKFPFFFLEISQNVIVVF